MSTLHSALCTVHCAGMQMSCFSIPSFGGSPPSWYPPIHLPLATGGWNYCCKTFHAGFTLLQEGRERANTKIDDEPKNYLVNWPTLFVLQISSLCYDGAPLAAVHPLIEYQLTFLAIKIKMRHCFAFDFSIFQLMVVFHCWPKYAHILDWPKCNVAFHTKIKGFVGSGWVLEDNPLSFHIGQVGAGS